MQSPEQSSRGMGQNYRAASTHSSELHLPRSKGLLFLRALHQPSVVTPIALSEGDSAASVSQET